MVCFRTASDGARIANATLGKAPPPVRGVAAIGPDRAGVFIRLMPRFGAAVAMAFRGERPGACHVAGAALVLCGVALAGCWPGAS